MKNVIRDDSAREAGHTTSLGGRRDMCHVWQDNARGGTENA